MSLKDEFKKYIGETIRNPWRMTCDIDPKAEEMSQTARKYGYTMLFSSATEQKADTPYSEKYIDVQVDPQGAGYTVKSFKIN